MDLETRAEVFHGGTYSANPPVMAAMNVAERIGDLLEMRIDLVAFVDEDIEGRQVFFSEEPVTRFRQGRRNDAEFYHHFQMEMQARGVYFHNYQMERWFASTAHTAEDVARTLEIAKEVVPIVKDRLAKRSANEAT